jgi:hypothetical protein
MSGEELHTIDVHDCSAVSRKLLQIKDIHD